MDLNKFDEIQHLPLRVFNRTVFLNNLMEDGGPEAAKRYIQIFSEQEQKQIYITNACIKHMGIERVRKECTKGLVLVEDGYEHN